MACATCLVAIAGPPDEKPAPSPALALLVMGLGLAGGYVLVELVRRRVK